MTVIDKQYLASLKDRGLDCSDTLIPTKKMAWLMFKDLPDPPAD